MTMRLTSWDVRVGGVDYRIREVDELGLAAAIHRHLEPRITRDFHVRLNLNQVTLQCNGTGAITTPDGQVITPIRLRVNNAGRAVA